MPKSSKRKIQAKNASLKRKIYVTDHDEISQNEREYEESLNQLETNEQNASQSSRS